MKPKRKIALEDCPAIRITRGVLSAPLPPDVELTRVRSNLPAAGAAYFVLLLVCPRCERNCRSLFRPVLGLGWACRMCHFALVDYKSQAMSNRARAVRRLNQLRARLPLRRRLGSGAWGRWLGQLSAAEERLLRLLGSL
jgi:hypothetical protein